MPTPILGLPYPTDSDLAHVPRDLKALADAIDPLGVVPVGGLCLWPTAIAPAAWLICDGHQVLAADYPKLSAVLGSAGGQITLPNLSDRFPCGPGANPLLGSGGAATVALGDTNVPPHAHSVALGTNNTGTHGHALSIAGANVVDPAHVFAVAGGVTYANLANAGPGVIVPISTADTWHGESGNHGHIGSTATPDGAHTHTVNGNTGAYGGSGGGAVAHENRPPFLAVNFIIRAL
jgi:microcystin-dependent protein